MTDCWFARLPAAGPCSGPPVRCHLLPKQLLRQKFPKGAYLIDGRWLPPVEARFDARYPAALDYRTLRALQDDPRAWVAGCGGWNGIGGHHGRFDTAPHDRTRLRVPIALWPAATLDYARELGLSWWVEKHHP